jgi:hypothetical protein
MKQTKNTLTCLMAVGLMTMAAAITARAAAPPALNGQLVLRPLTPGDKTTYGLPSALEVSGGLTTVGIGTPVYLEAEVNSAIAVSTITNVVWALSSKPIGSMITFSNSPLGTNVPIYEIANRSGYQVAYTNVTGGGGRALLRPDVPGQYTVSVTIYTSGSGSTNLTQTITAATYYGVQTCTYCHSGGVDAQDMYQSWTTTGHSMIFSNGICGYIVEGGVPFYKQSCLPCHTVGYDTTPSSTNDDGFYSEMLQTGWTFPSVLSPTNWAALPAALQNLGNIQCENCHGPGGQHGYSNGIFGNTNCISVTVSSGDCNQCHDDAPGHPQGTQWYASVHANPVGISGAKDWECVGCHTSDGFIGRMSNFGSTNAYATNTVFSAIACQACHEPHGQSMPTNNPHLIRIMGAVTMPDGTVITNAGEGALCLQCHKNEGGSATNQLVKYPQGQYTWYGGSTFGASMSPQGDMIEGINANTYGQTIPSSAHCYSVSNLCVGCHMQTLATTDPGFLLAGGHTFNMSYTVITNGVTNTVNKVDVCVPCHGPISSFNFLCEDFEGIGVIEGPQTAVQNLLNKLSTLLPNSTYQANSNNYVADGLVKTGRLTVQTNWPQKFLMAAYNWEFVNSDGSKGVHNTPYAVGLLKASIGNLTGDANKDGLPDSWQSYYFTSSTNPAAAPNVMDVDGLPNWANYLLGLDPLVPSVSVTNGLAVGVVWADGSTLNNPIGPTNTIQIYNAAEIVFNTVTNKTYQIQAASSLSSGWQNIGEPIVGTGQAYSYVTPTRPAVMQFYRVYSY